MRIRPSTESRTRCCPASREMPATSLRKRFLPPAGNRITNTITIPKPPSQCENERQNDSARGRPSMPSGESTVAPVVVKPETDSKNASPGEANVPAKRYGSAPPAPATIQVRPTTARPSRRK